MFNYNSLIILLSYFMLTIRGQLSSVDKFIIFSISINSLFYKGLRGYLPQQFLYFFPLPQVLSPLIYILYMVFNVLYVFQWFHRQVTIYTDSIYSIYFIIFIYLLRTNREHCSQYFILLN